MHRVGELLVVSLSDLLDPSFPVQALSDGLVGLYELVQLLRQLFILMGDYTNVVVQRVNLHLQVRVVVQQSRVTVPGSLQLFAHIHNLIFFRPYFAFQLLYAISQIDVPSALLVNPLLQV